MLCPRCSHILYNTMSFSSDGNYKFKSCPNCHFTTIKKRLDLKNYGVDKIDYQKQNKSIHNFKRKIKSNQ